MVGHHIHPRPRHPKYNDGATAANANNKAAHPNPDLVFLSFSRRSPSYSVDRTFSNGASRLFMVIGYAERPNDPRRRMARLLHKQEA
jgi:hypothetical protein